MTREKEPSCLIAGFLDVKLPARNRRRRFGPWKSWRRHWVEARRCADRLDLLLSPARLGGLTGLAADKVVMRVPVGAAVGRTTSRSRSHAFVIASSDGEDDGEAYIVYLAARSEVDMDLWMAALLPSLSGSSETSPAGPTLPSRPQPQTRALSAASTALLRGRRLSRSEGDLLAGSPLTEAADVDLDRSRVPDVAPSALSSFRLMIGGRRRAETLRVDGLSASPPSTSASALSLLGGKIASSLISAGLGLMMSTPGGSEVEDNDVDNDVAENGQDRSLVEALERRRESAVSVASGIYEEILDSDGTGAIERLYENVAMAGRRQSNHYEDPALLYSPRDASGGEPTGPTGIPSVRVSPPGPPPLPPRENLTPITELLSRSTGCLDQTADDCTDVDANGYVQMDQCRTPGFTPGFKPGFTTGSTKHAVSRDAGQAEPAYLPMSPIRPAAYGHHHHHLSNI